MEHQIDGTVTGQRLEFTKKPELIVDGTNKYITAIFKFSPDWNGLSIWAHFDRGNSHWKIHLHDGEILRSDKLNLTQGVWEVSLHGTAVDGMRITTEPVDLNVRRTNIDGDAPLGDAPASPLEQLDQRVTALEAGGGGGGGGTTDHAKLINRNQPDQHPMEAITGLVELRDKINAFLDADDSTLDQLTELIAAIKANQGTIEQLTNGKINTADIVNDLTTGGAGKVLSAEMGVELKRLIDSIEPPDLASQVEAAQTAAREAGRSASNAAGSADTANAAAGRADSAAETARGYAQTASTQAGNAAQSATTATEQASAAAGSAATATSEADRAKREADRAAQATPKLEPLTFTGSTSAVYDGTKPVTVPIPTGDGDSKIWEVIDDFTTDQPMVVQIKDLNLSAARVLAFSNGDVEVPLIIIHTAQGYLFQAAINRPYKNMMIEAKWENSGWNCIGCSSKSETVSETKGPVIQYMIPGARKPPINKISSAGEVPSGVRIIVEGIKYGN